MYPVRYQQPGQTWPGRRIVAGLMLVALLLVSVACGKPSPIGEINDQATVALLRFEKINQDFSGVVYREINDYAAFVSQSELPILVVFYHPMNTDNPRIIPLLEEMADDYQGRLAIVWINGTAEPRLAEGLGARTLPQFTVLVHSQVQQSLVGFGPTGEAAVQELITPYLK